MTRTEDEVHTVTATISPQCCRIQIQCVFEPDLELQALAEAMKVDPSIRERVNERVRLKLKWNKEDIRGRP